MLSEWWVLSLIVSVVGGHAPCQQSYGGCRYNEPFVPAPVGQIPRRLISYLVTKVDKNFKTFFNEEKLSDNPYSYSKNYQYNETNIDFAGYPDRRYNLPHVSLTQSPPPLGNQQWNSNPVESGYKRRKRQVEQDQLCQVNINNVYPRAALNTQGEWKYVVNMVRTPSDMYTQSIRSEICASPDQPCSGICETPFGYTTTCKQKYVQKRLVALQGTGDNLYIDVFWFPHCCSCTIGRV
ncbi:uncharacterized protein LOC126905705 isoform X2 [Daktulosphaira vitifoliae]|uniref:uncharacterized protein LOC126905705 isoform X2 n=1 Tax=Daktulosphaira vitifoliae TaxID=58002 RepID=UPI0021AAD5D8|nr:uncharacterized protein LOC126905705 isoform X2 [Daktulosphaira vitifoliae]